MHSALCVMRCSVSGLLPRNEPTNRTVQVFSGCIPFHHVVNDYQVMNRVIDGRRPPRPILSEPWHQPCTSLGLNDHLWDLIEDCWKAQREHRPTAKEAIDRLPRRAGNPGGKDDACPLLPATSATENIIAWAISRPRHEIDLVLPDQSKEGIVFCRDPKGKSSH